MKQDSCAAPARLPRLSQVVKIDTVRVRTPRYSLAPMSLRVSSDTSATPTASAGRAIGSETRQNTVQRLAPSVRAASPNSALWNWNMVRADR